MIVTSKKLKGGKTRFRSTILTPECIALWKTPSGFVSLVMAFSVNIIICFSGFVKWEIYLSKTQTFFKNSFLFAYFLFSAKTKQVPDVGV